MKHPFAIAAIALVALLATAGRAHAVAPCCGVTAIDARTGIVTAKDNASGQVFQFHVPQAASLRTLRVGSSVYADFATKKVSLKPSDPCCSITAMSAAPAAGVRPYTPVDGLRRAGALGNAGRP